MNQPMRIGQTYFPSKPHGVAKQPTAVPAKKPFEHWLQDSLSTETGNEPNKVSFSQHALNRLRERGIQLADADIAKLEGAVQKAADKGSKESLIIMNQIAFVVNIANRKVITAVDELHRKENVFTNIDSAVLV